MRERKPELPKEEEKKDVEQEKKKEAPPPRISKEEHAKVLKKAEEANQWIDDCIGILYADLGENKSKESKKLDGIIDEIKENWQTIESSLHDLKVHKFTYDKEFYEKAKRDEKTIAKVYREYSLFSKDLVKYKPFRRRTLNIIREIKPKLPYYESEEEIEEVKQEIKPTKEIKKETKAVERSFEMEEVKKAPE